MKNEDIVPVSAPDTAQEEPEDDFKPGGWYWVKSAREEDVEVEARLDCLTSVGSNYLEFTSSGSGSSYRVHFDEFYRRCVPEPNAVAIIDQKIQGYQARTQKLLEQVRELTARLAIGPTSRLGDGSETKALSLRGASEDVNSYRDALLKAKDDTLPELFSQIRASNQAAAAWMSARLIPMQAEASKLENVTSLVKNRIFSVQLYAGLLEDVVEIRSGKPAAMTEKVRLLQRRCYMDEECLANYRTGGMDFESIEKFDEWLAEDENMNRVLPFPRCVVSFRVRRHMKERYGFNISDYIQIQHAESLDKLTFLYIRNGDQLYRMETGVEFGSKLFPDMDQATLAGKLWVKARPTSLEHDFLSDAAYQEKLRAYRREEQEFEAKNRAYEEALASPEAKARAKEKGLKEPDASCIDVPWPGFGPHWWNDYSPFDKSNVYYDDAEAVIKEALEEHNRIGLIIQGLLDRSHILHPHPPWQIWTPEGFNQALELVYDSSRALVGGEAPDFESYRAKLNATLKAGTVTIGQQDAWELAEGEKETNRRKARGGRDYYPKRYKPYGNPGPGLLAYAVNVTRSGKVTYEWERDKTPHRASSTLVRCGFTCSTANVLNVDAYKPGDFKVFFADPRTRAAYLEWAPVLLEAEEYHAGNRKVAQPPSGPKPKRVITEEGREEYRRQKARKAFTKAVLNNAVRLQRRITTRGGLTYEKGSLWRVYEAHRGTYSLHQIQEDGSPPKDVKYLSKIEPSDIELDPSVPGVSKKP